MLTNVRRMATGHASVQSLQNGREKNWEDYKKARNNVTKLLRSAETQYFLK